MKSLIKIDILSNLSKIIHEYTYNNIMFLQLGIVIIETILIILGVVLCLITKENKIILYLATIPNIILSLLIYLFSFIYDKNNKKVEETYNKIYQELDLLIMLNDNTISNNKEVYETFRNISKLNIPPYNIIFELNNEDKI